VLQQAVFPQLEATCHTTTARILEAFAQHRVGEEHFYSVTGYGHNDMGRDALDKVFASALQAPAALVRPHFVSGTHAISVGLHACLRHGDLLLSLTGSPYDTLEEVIGIRGESPLSLKAKGVHYQQFSVLEPRHHLNTTHGETPNPYGLHLGFSDEEKALIAKAKVLYFQRSRGYSTRNALCIEALRQCFEAAKAINPHAVVFVDNCYGEFTEAQEPTAVGADLLAGSLIKNPGGGLALTGGYVAGRDDLVALAGEALTCPGIGAEGGYLFDQTRTLLQGLFLAPTTVKEALKGMSLAAYVLHTQLGVKVEPAWDSPVPRSDIIQTLFLGSEAALIEACRLVQRCSPISSYVTPVPSHAPGYESALIMAGGTFVDGSSVELSADAPLRAPWVLYLQGGLTYAHTRYLMGQWLQTAFTSLR
jgi:cystathionine beta-lyase family protein involved in aluminum resistance